MGRYATASTSIGIAMAEFFAVIDKRPMAVNFGTLAGHAHDPPRDRGEALRDLTKNELNVFARTLECALAEGAFGFSTGLAYVHAGKHRMRS